MGGTQSITYLGTPYEFPSDAKDDEILQFLSKQPHADSPIPPPLFRKPPAPQMQEESFSPSEQDQLSAVHPLTEAANVVGGGLKSIAQVSTPAIAASLMKKRVPDMGQLSTEGGAHSPLVNSIMTQGLLAHSGGLESSTEEAASRGGVSGAAPRESMAAPSMESAATTPASSVVESTPLVRKVPNSRSIVRDVAGLAHGAMRPTSISGLTDFATSIKSILERVNANDPPPTEANPPRGPMDKGAGTYGTPVSQWGKRVIESKPDLSNRTPPNWKSAPDTGGTPVEYVAPHVQGSPTPADISTMLERTGPPRGGKGQVGRAILRRNVRGMKVEGDDAPITPLEREAQGEGTQHRVVGTSAELAIGAKPKLVKSMPKGSK